MAETAVIRPLDKLNGVDSGSIRDRFGVDSGSIQGRFGIEVRSRPGKKILQFLFVSGPSGARRHPRPGPGGIKGPGQEASKARARRHQRPRPGGIKGPGQEASKAHWMCLGHIQEPQESYRTENRWI